MAKRSLQEKTCRMDSALCRGRREGGREGGKLELGVEQHLSLQTSWECGARLHSLGTKKALPSNQYSQTCLYWSLSACRTSNSTSMCDCVHITLKTLHSIYC